MDIPRLNPSSKNIVGIVELYLRDFYLISPFMDHDTRKWWGSLSSMRVAKVPLSGISKF